MVLDVYYIYNFKADGGTLNADFDSDVASPSIRRFTAQTFLITQACKNHGVLSELGVQTTIELGARASEIRIKANAASGNASEFLDAKNNQTQNTITDH